MGFKAWRLGSGGGGGGGLNTNLSNLLAPTIPPVDIDLNGNALINGAHKTTWNVQNTGTVPLDVNGDCDITDPFIRIDTFASAATDNCNHVTQTAPMNVGFTLAFWTPISSSRDVTYVANFDAAAGYLNFPSNQTMLTTKASMNVYRAGSNRWHLMAAQLL